MRAHIPEAALNDYADGLLPPDQTAGVELHLAACDECGAYVRRLRALSVRLSAAPREGEPGRDLWAGVAARIAAAETAEPVTWETAGSVADDDRESVPGVIPLRSRRAPAATVWLQRAAAAAVLFVGGVGVGQRVGAAPVRVVTTPTQTLSPLQAPAATPTAAATDIQRTGSEYVRAMATFASLSDEASPREVAQAREAAMSALYSAAKALTELPGADSSAVELFRTVAEARARAAGPSREAAALGDSTPGVRF